MAGEHVRKELVRGPGWFLATFPQIGDDLNPVPIRS